MDKPPLPSKPDLLTTTVDLVLNYISTNSVPAAELPAVITRVHAALTGLTEATPGEDGATVKLTPAQIRKSIRPDALMSFENGKPYKTLHRHLTSRGLTPETYRVKWGLKPDYPMTSAVYSSQRSKLARGVGLDTFGVETLGAEDLSVEGSVAEDLATKGLGSGRRPVEASIVPAVAPPGTRDAHPVPRRGRPPGKAKALANA